MRIPLFLSAILAASALAGPAWSQAIGGMGGMGGMSGRGGPAPSASAASEAPHQAPPPALPGSHVQAAIPAPAGKPSAEMSPNDALFDAINRGDLASARDAVSRGADPDARNVLGMTPLELSVDLNRNEISFLLLGLRGGEHPPAAMAAAPPHAPSRAPAVASARDRAPSEVAEAKDPVVNRPRTPPLFAGNGGRPAPQVGFLGFDSGR